MVSFNSGFFTAKSLDYFWTGDIKVGDSIAHHPSPEIHNPI